MKEIELTQMLYARERRAATQKELIAQFHKPLISLTLNIPGPRKVLCHVPEAFLLACDSVNDLLAKEGISVLKETIIKEDTGYEACYCVDGEALAIKKLMVYLEDNHQLGRLFDLDVLTGEGDKISREELGFPPRRCMLCGENAHVCSRSRKHSVTELIAYINTILKASCRKD